MTIRERAEALAREEHTHVAGPRTKGKHRRMHITVRLDPTIVLLLLDVAPVLSDAIEKTVRSNARRRGEPRAA